MKLSDLTMKINNFDHEIARFYHENELLTMNLTVLVHESLFTILSTIECHNLDSGLNNGPNTWTKVSITKVYMHINRQQTFKYFLG